MWRQTTENVFHEFFVIENRNYDELNFFKMEEKNSDRVRNSLGGWL